MLAHAKYSEMNAMTLLETQPHVKLTLDGLLAMLEQRIIDPSRKYELVDGVVFEMPSEGLSHRYLKSALIAHLNRTLPSTYFVMADATLDLGPGDAPSPDVYVIPSDKAQTAVTPGDVLLVIEVADTTLADDLGVKADLYARYGVGEYWVVDIARGAIWAHRKRDGARWAARVEIGADEEARCAAVPEVAVRLADLRR
ncbi:MAG: Uma2 family endonuclease [Pseudomonadota bacterium]